MKTSSRFGLVSVVSATLLLAGEALAVAAPCNLTPPPECADAARNESGWNSGLNTGVAITQQIWRSPKVGRNPDNWEILQSLVTTTIPTVVTSALSGDQSQYTKCRVQGFLEGTTCEMGHINPIPGCVLDGVDWGKISATVYCDLSIALAGLGDLPPWFIRQPQGLCGQGFESACEDVYRFGASNGYDGLEPDLLAYLQSISVDPETFKQGAACVPFTQTPFQTVFDDSVAIDCSYVVPPM